MTKIALVADLHFGSVPAGLAETLRLALLEQNPDLIVVAGDLTMRSRSHEFVEAKAWLASLTAPLMLLPGNHDVPFWNIYERFTSPFARYAKATGAPSMPIFEDERCFILGLNTTASWHPNLKWQEGIARRTDVAAAEKLLAAAPPHKVRVVATHHPLFAVKDMPRARPVRRFGNALDMLSRQKVVMLMHGHLHQQYAMHMQHGDAQFLAIGAPTALSSRVRGEPNGFWLIEVAPEHFSLTLYRLYEGGFTAGTPRLISREPEPATEHSGSTTSVGENRGPAYEGLSSAFRGEESD